MGKPTGFLEYERKDAVQTPPLERIKNFNEFKKPLPLEEQQIQGARCMECGVPFCQAGMMIAGMASGCPLHNLVPETNDLVYRGKWRQAYERLSKTHSFPEFTSHVCPALCEAACTCNLNGEPVATKDNEKAIIETAWKNGWVVPQVPPVRTGKKVAVVGSGPSGLAAAQELNRKGHWLTVFDRNDRVGGLLRYGIPNMKLDKSIIDRRIKLMEEEGVVFKTCVDVGKDVKAQDLLKEFDRVILACGASNPRDIQVPGRDAGNIYFAVDFLKSVTKSLLAVYSCKRKTCTGHRRRRHRKRLCGNSHPSGRKIRYSVRDDAKAFRNQNSWKSMAGVAEDPESGLRPGRIYRSLRKRPQGLSDYRKRIYQRRQRQCAES